MLSINRQATSKPVTEAPGGLGALPIDPLDEFWRLHQRIRDEAKARGSDLMEVLALEDLAEQYVTAAGPLLDPPEPT